MNIFLIADYKILLFIYLVTIINDPIFHTNYGKYI